MQITGHIAPDNLMTLEAYSKWRKTEKPSLVAHRRLRSVELGGNMSLQFESERTIRYQIQEMLRIERIFEEAGIQGEIDVYKHLVPGGSNWKATMMIEYPDTEERKRELGRLINVEDRVYVEVPVGEDQQRSYAIADEDLPRENAEKTSAVHFLRFEFSPEQIAALKAGQGATLGCDHANYTARAQIGAETLISLVSDLR